MKKTVLCISLCMLFLTGCVYGTDVDEQAFVIAVGLEPGTQYNYRATFVFSNPSSGSSGDKGGGGSDKGKSSDIVTLEAPTVFSAVRRLNDLKSKKINLTHTKIVIFSDKLAKDGISDIVEGLSSSRDFRPNTLLCISSGSAEDYLKAVNPKQETFIDKYFDHSMQKVVTDSVNETYLYYLYFNIVDTNFGSLVPLVGTSSKKLDEATPASSLSDDFALNDFAGDIIKDAENDAEISGGAILKDGKLVAKIGSLYTDISRLICDEFHPDSYSFIHKESGKYVTIRIMQHARIRTDAKFVNGHAVIKKEVPIDIRYVDPAGVIKNKEDSDRFLSYVCSLLSEKADALILKSQTEYNSDFLGLGEDIKHLFKDLDSWDKFNWKEKYRDADIKIKFTVNSTDYEEVK